MQFCTSCGEKVPPGSKFCENCGAPLGQTGEDPARAAGHGQGTPPAQVPVPPSGRPAVTMFIIAGAAVLIIAAAVFFAGLPYLQKIQKTTDVAMPPTPPVTLLPVTTTPVMIPDTPVVITETPTPIIITEGRYEETYEQIYSRNKSFAFGEKVPFTYLLTRPPLYIKFNLTPVMVTHHRMVDIGLSSEHMVNTTNASPYAWFEIKILDAGSGAVLDQQGYGNDYSDLTKQEFMVRKPGNYTVVMSGNDVTAEVRMLIGT